MMYLIVGLSNPGKEYEKTRHNIGSRVVRAMLEYLAKEGVSAGAFRKEGSYSFCKLKYKGNDFLFVLPETFMNLSGDAVQRARDFYKIPNENIVIISDDVNLEVGAVRLRFGGGDGGHNGLKSVIGLIGDSFWRLRVGVGINDIPLEDYVLQKPTPEEEKILSRIIDEQAENVLDSISENSLKNDTNKIN